MIGAIWRARQALPRRTRWPLGHAIGLALAGAVFGYWTWSVIMGSPAVPVMDNDPWLNAATNSARRVALPAWPATLLTALLAVPVARLLIRREGKQFLKTIAASAVVCVGSVTASNIVFNLATGFYNHKGWFEIAGATASSAIASLPLAPMLLFHPPGVVACVGLGLLAAQLASWLE